MYRGSVNRTKPLTSQGMHRIPAFCSELLYCLYVMYHHSIIQEEMYHSSATASCLPGLGNTCPPIQEQQLTRKPTHQPQLRLLASQGLATHACLITAGCYVIRAVIRAHQISTKCARLEVYGCSWIQCLPHFNRKPRNPGCIRSAWQQHSVCKIWKCMDVHGFCGSLLKQQDSAQCRPY